MTGPAPRPAPRPGPLRGLGVAGLAALALAILGTVLGADLARAATLAGAGRLGAQPFEDLLVWSCEATALIVGAWLTLLTWLVALDAHSGRMERRAGCPEWLRRAVLVACGVGVAAALSSPAGASSGPADRAAAGGPGGPIAALSGLAYPDRAEDTPRPPGAEPTRGTARERVVVVAGDTLWHIAEQSLPPGANNARIDARWREIHARNRAVLGPDPDLIHPGTVLRVPEPKEAP